MSIERMGYDKVVKVMARYPELLYARNGYLHQRIETGAGQELSVAISRAVRKILTGDPILKYQPPTWIDLQVVNVEQADFLSKNMIEIPKGYDSNVLFPRYWVRTG